MGIDQKEYIYRRWDLINDEVQRAIFSEFKMKNRGFYTEKEFLSFLERKLVVDLPALPCFSSGDLPEEAPGSSS
jgi:hypothetical protein